MIHVSELQLLHKQNLRCIDLGCHEPRVTPGFSHLGIEPNDTAGRRIFSGISRFFPPLHSDDFPCSPRFTLVDFQYLDVKSCRNLCTPLPPQCGLASSGNSSSSPPGRAHNMTPPFSKKERTFSSVALRLAWMGAVQVVSCSIRPGIRGSLPPRAPQAPRLTSAGWACWSASMGAARLLPPAKSWAAFLSLLRHLDHVTPASQSRTTRVPFRTSGYRWSEDHFSEEIWAALNVEASRADECELRMQGRGTGDLQGNPPSSSVVQRDSHIRKCGGGPAGNRIWFALVRDDNIIKLVYPNTFIPTKTIRVQSPAGSLDFRKWELCQTMPLLGGFSRGSPVSPTPSFRCRSIFTSIILIGSQYLAV
ncbi:hypothetical protein PR048_002033 [Dryococelus australis]|uniref:Uncharacterized protein n=1 Tax=Dryococelus australis TaxID=614101 RepID=A0ABQ9IJ14_9NEOP|nr:hypothetical protein PR048_002033 [Dryococelus australis]